MIDDLLAIIVLNYNDFQTTKKCVNQLLKIGVDYQIIIVDNCSNDNSFLYLQQIWKNCSNIFVIQSAKNGGYSYGNNQGMLFANTIADFKYYCIMNPDVIVEENYFSELCGRLAVMPEYAVIAPVMIYPDKLDLSRISWKMRTAKEIYLYHFLLWKRVNCKIEYTYLGNGLVEADAVPGSFFIVDAKMMKEIGYFDDNIFLYNEETALAKKFEKIGKKNLLCIDKYFIHNHIYKNNNVWENYRNNFKQVVQNYKITYESRRYLCEAYYEKKYIIRLKMVKVFNLILLYIKHIISLFMIKEY